jgi:hypothetical protein
LGFQAPTVRFTHSVKVLHWVSQVKKTQGNALTLVGFYSGVLLQDKVDASQPISFTSQFFSAQHLRMKNSAARCEGTDVI